MILEIGRVGFEWGRRMSACKRCWRSEKAERHRCRRGRQRLEGWLQLRSRVGKRQLHPR